MLPPTWQTITQKYSKYLLSEVLHLCASSIATFSSLPPDCFCTFLKFNNINRGKKEIMLCFLLESVPQNGLVVSHQPTQARACWPSTSWGIMSQDCHVWSATQNCSVEVCPWTGWLSEGENGWLQLNQLYIMLKIKPRMSKYKGCGCNIYNQDQQR